MVFIQTVIFYIFVDIFLVCFLIFLDHHPIHKQVKIIIVFAKIYLLELFKRKVSIKREFNEDTLNLQGWRRILVVSFGSLARLRFLYKVCVTETFSEFSSDGLTVFTRLYHNVQSVTAQVCPALALPTEPFTPELALMGRHTFCWIWFLTRRRVFFSDFETWGLIHTTKCQLLDY